MPPRIPKAELERLKSEVSLEQLVRARGVKLVRRGKDLHGRCPMHEDRTASLVVSPEVNLWHCLGACQTGGSVLDWVMKTEAVSLRHAVELLRAGLPQAGSGPVRARTRSTARKLPKLASPDADDAALLARVVTFYHQTLQETTEAKELLERRGLKDSRLVETFRLGFANRTLGYRLPSRDSEAGRTLRTRLQDLGVLRQTGHEHLRGCLVVPLFDEHGRVVQLYGRKVGKVKTAQHLYLAGPQRGVFNREALAHSEEIILCESILDAMTFWCAGLRNVTTTFGAGKLHEDLLEAMKAAGTKRVLIAYDRDKAGEAGAKKVAEELMAAGITAYRIHFPRGMDANEYALQVTPAKRSLALVVRHAEWMGEGREPEREEPTTEPELEDQDPSPPAAPEDGEVDGGRSREGDGRTEETGRGLAAAPPSGAGTLRTEATVALEPSEPDPSQKSATKEEVPASLRGEPEPLRPDPPSEAEVAPGPPPGVPSLAALPGPETSSAPPEPTAYRVPPRELAPELTRHGEELRVELGDRRYRVRGLAKNQGATTLRVNLRVTREASRDLPAGAGFHVDTLDLYLARPRDAFARKAGMELGCEEATILRDLGVLLGLLETAQEEELKVASEPRAEVPEMSDLEREEALELLQSPDLLGRILEDYQRCGVVGEETNKLVGYLAAVSRKLKAPLAVVIQSSSAAGKSSLQDAVLQFMPREERVSYSAMTGQSLFYMSGTDLRHKILSIAEEEGAQRASYALKLLQSEGELTIASTGKDATSGRLTTHEYHVEGPVMIFLTTTAIDMDEELLNRCLVLTVDEGREQTRAIHQLQRDRQTLDGVFADAEREDTLRTHRNAQRLLRPLRVVNPFAHELTFLDHQTRCRRDHTKYLSLIQAITLLHQYQREVKTERRGDREITYVEVSREDIAIADRLLEKILARSMDELPPQTRRLLRSITQMVEARCQAEGVPREEVRFTRREVRQFSGAGDTQARTHMRRLEELEYLLVHSGGRGQLMVYELLVPDGEEQASPDPTGYDPNLAGQAENLAGGWRGQSGGVAARKRGPGGPAKPAPEAKESQTDPSSSQNAHLEAEVSGRRTRSAGKARRGRRAGSPRATKANGSRLPATTRD